MNQVASQDKRYFEHWARQLQDAATFQVWCMVHAYALVFFERLGYTAKIAAKILGEFEESHDEFQEV